MCYVLKIERLDCRQFSYIFRLYFFLFFRAKRDVSLKDYLLAFRLLLTVYLAVCTPSPLPMPPIPYAPLRWIEWWARLFLIWQTRDSSLPRTSGASTNVVAVQFIERRIGNVVVVPSRSAFCILYVTRKLQMFVFFCYGGFCNFGHYNSSVKLPWNVW